MPEELGRYIDHTLLRPDATYDEIDALCAEAEEFQFASVCVNPNHVRRAAKVLGTSRVRVCSVVGFPLGAHMPEIKALEARRAIRDGAEETAGPRGVQLYPFLICDAKEATTQAERAGYARRQRVADAIRAASEETGIPLLGDGGDGDETTAPYEVVINDENFCVHNE